MIAVKICAGIMFSCCVFIAVAMARPSATASAPSPEAALPQAGLGVGASFVVGVPEADYLRELDERERRDQLRDWAVIATVARLGATASQAAAATHELPPARLPYLDELYLFESGRGRRAYVGPRALMFCDRDDPDLQATIGRLADRVRMENGDVPDTVEIYLVDDLRDGSLRVERAPDVRRAELFSEAYGYVEGDGGDLVGLATWLARADDLTFAQIVGDGRLRLGGRRFARTRTANLVAEDTAALYQAHVQLGQPRARSANVPGQVRVPGVPGFSLDPQWLPDPANPQHPLMLARLRKLAAGGCREIRAIAERGEALAEQEPDETRRLWRTWMAGYVGDLLQNPELVPKLDDICAKIETQLAPELVALASAIDRAAPDTWDRGFGRYYELVQRWRQRPQHDAEWGAGVLTAAALKFHETDTRAQCARYVGLRGTRAGMTLFYTDLLAKLMAMDFGSSAPTAAVSGFVTPPKIDLPPAFLLDMQRNSGTRLWFGARADGVARIGSGEALTLLFDHPFSRIYAAGSNPARPDAEVPPSELSRRMLGWWDRHFDDVADYEQEYHRQNQLMKWALVTAALIDTPSARYLATVPVRRDLTFFDWQRANRANLRFAEKLPADPRAPSGKECLPLLGSYGFPSLGTVMHVSGGVRTVSRDEARGVPQIRPDRPLGARKDDPGDLGGSVRRAHPKVLAGRVTFADAKLARTRDRSGDIDLGVPRVEYRRPAAQTLSIRVAGGAVGELVVEVHGDSSTIRWIDGEVERKRHEPRAAAAGE